MERANLDLRREISEAGLTLWRVGFEWKGINDVSTVRRFRFELSEQEKAEVRAVIGKLKKESGGVTKRAPTQQKQKEVKHEKTD